MRAKIRAAIASCDGESERRAILLAVVVHHEETEERHALQTGKDVEEDDGVLGAILREVDVREDTDKRFGQHRHHCARSVVTSARLQRLVDEKEEEHCHPVEAEHHEKPQSVRKCEERKSQDARNCLAQTPYASRSCVNTAVRRVMMTSR